MTGLIGVPRKKQEMILQQSNHQQPEEKYDPIAIGLKISERLVRLRKFSFVVPVVGDQTVAC
jgi:hypothetical protein